MLASLVVRLDPTTIQLSVGWRTAIVTITATIADKMEGRNARQCRERWKNVLDPAIIHGAMSAAEDAKIIALVCEHNTKWARMSQALNGRTEQAIKNRWNGHLKQLVAAAALVAAASAPAPKSSASAATTTSSSSSSASTSASSSRTLVEQQSKDKQISSKGKSFSSLTRSEVKAALALGAAAAAAAAPGAAASAPAPKSSRTLSSDKKKTKKYEKEKTKQEDAEKLVVAWREQNKDNKSTLKQIVEATNKESFRWLLNHKETKKANRSQYKTKIQTEKQKTKKEDAEKLVVAWREQNKDNKSTLKQIVEATNKESFRWLLNHKETRSKSSYEKEKTKKEDAEKLVVAWREQNKDNKSTLKQIVEATNNDLFRWLLNNKETKKENSSQYRTKITAENVALKNSIVVSKMTEKETHSTVKHDTKIGYGFAAHILAKYPFVDLYIGQGAPHRIPGPDGRGWPNPVTNIVFDGETFVSLITPNGKSEKVNFDDESVSFLGRSGENTKMLMYDGTKPSMGIRKQQMRYLVPFSGPGQYRPYHHGALTESSLQREIVSNPALVGRLLNNTWAVLPSTSGSASAEVFLTFIDRRVFMKVDPQIEQAQPQPIGKYIVALYKGEDDRQRYTPKLSHESKTLCGY